MKAVQIDFWIREFVQNLRLPLPNFRIWSSLVYTSICINMMLLLDGARNVANSSYGSQDVQLSMQVIAYMGPGTVN